MLKELETLAETLRLPVPDISSSQSHLLLNGLFVGTLSVSPVEHLG